MIHAHKVLTLISQSPASYTVAELRASVEKEFGQNTQFTNCSGSLMSFDDMIDFFISREKIRIDEKGIIELKLQNICSN